MVKSVLPVKRDIFVYVLDVFFSFVLPYQNLDQGATAVVLQFEFSPPNCLKITLSYSLKGSTLAILKCHLLVDKEMSLWWNEWNECCSATGTSVFHLPARLKWHHKVSWSHMCKFVIIFLTVVWFWADCMVFWLLIHSHCPFPEHLSQISVFFGLPLPSLTVSDVLCSHTQGENGESGVPRGKGEKGEGGDPVRIFLRWHLQRRGYTVINQGLLPQGQPGAEGTSGMKGQKVSHVNVKSQTW